LAGTGDATFDQLADAVESTMDYEQRAAATMGG
jgi:hypothetical protein